jgi:hypothetical protein
MELNDSSATVKRRRAGLALIWIGDTVISTNMNARSRCVRPFVRNRPSRPAHRRLRNGGWPISAEHRPPRPFTLHALARRVEAT